VEWFGQENGSTWRKPCPRKTKIDLHCLYIFVPYLTENTACFQCREQPVDWLIDLQWDQPFTVPMHLGLTDRPFVPHNLISAQDSPVTLPKFQMAPRLKILMSSGSKKGTQIYYLFLSKKSRQVNPIQFPNGAPIERDTRLQGIFTYLLIYLFISKAHDHQNRGHYGNRRPFQNFT
jgi:hypothetical protein